MTKQAVQDTIIIVEYTDLLEKRNIFSRPPSIDIDIEERDFGEGDDVETKEIYVFTILLEVRPGGAQ